MKKLWVFLLGGPGEDAQTLEETLDFARNKLGANDIVFFNIGIRVYPNTEIESIARREGIIDAAADLLYPAFYVSPRIRRQAIEARLKAEKSQNILTIKDIRLPFLPALLRAHNLLRLKSPYWAYAPALNRLRGLLWQK